ERAERAVDVQPEVVALADVGDLVERVARAGVDRSRLRDDDRGLDAGGAVALDRLDERLDAHPVLVVDRDRADAAGAEAERPERLVVREVQLVAPVDGELRQWTHALLLHVHPVALSEAVARDGE